jgi:transcriptional/translational regulatory protein YebC/TACO1
MEAALEGGAEDISEEEGVIVVKTTPEDFEAVANVLAEKGFESMSAEISMVADVEVELDQDGATKAMRLIDRLEDNDDVQNVYSNVSLPEGFEAE